MGRGLAYGLCDRMHLLNVVASRMGAFADKPEGFFDWLKQEGIVAGAHDFMPRALYGAYLESIALQTLALLRRQGRSITFHEVQAEHVRPAGDGWEIFLPGHSPLTASRAVLATGVVPTATQANDPPHLTLPWGFDFNRLQDDERPVVILGQGLSMIDVVASLAARDFAGPIIAVSRRGLLPRIHASAPGQDIATLEGRLRPLEGKLSRRLKNLRFNLRVCESAGIEWQAYFDSLRPKTHRLWASLSDSDKGRFFRRLMPYWNIHRHRQPCQSYEMLQRLQREKKLFLHSGTVAWQGNDAAMGGSVYRNVSHVFNCRGPDYGMLYRADNLAGRMVREKLLRLHPTGYGVVVDDALQAAPGLHILGSLTVGQFLETTAVTDLREHCARLAQIICSSEYP